MGKGMCELKSSSNGIEHFSEDKVIFIFKFFFVFTFF